MNSDGLNKFNKSSSLSDKEDLYNINNIIISSGINDLKGNLNQNNQANSNINNNKAQMIKQSTNNSELHDCNFNCNINCNINSQKQITHNSISIEIPKAPISDNSYSDFTKILKAYLKELKDLNTNNSILSQEDILVLNDLIGECNQYIVVLIENFPMESQEILELTEKIISSFFLVFKNIFKNNNSVSVLNENNNSKNTLNDSIVNTNKLISFPFVLKLSTLEVKYQLFINLYLKEKSKLICQKDLTKLLDECDAVITDIVAIQEQLNMNDYYKACSKFYYAIIQFFKSSYYESISYCKEAIDLLENKNQSDFIDDDESNLFELETRQICKLSTIHDFLAQIYEVLQE